MQQTRIPLDLIATPSDGDVSSQQGGLVVTAVDAEVSTLSGGYDSAAGALTLKIPKMGVLTISGFPVLSDLGEGRQGMPGLQGRAGVDGSVARDGDQGPAGCPGPRGARGETGKDGPRGQQGIQGPTGPRGVQGIPGKDGAFLVYMQTEDPATTGQPMQAGAIWIKP